MPASSVNTKEALCGEQIIEAGSHDELMVQQGFYYNLFMTQFRGQASAVA